MPRQLKENGVADLDLKLSTSVIRHIIERYTREAGVRNLERTIGEICRKVARSVAEGKKPLKNITIEEVGKLLGPTKFDPDFLDRYDSIGVVTGLAWTAYGGDVLPVEVALAPGKGALSLTGQLGDVMQESAKAAVFYARSQAAELGIPADFYEKLDIHIHCPSGATPKDGPSAGVTITTALISALLKKKVAQRYSDDGRDYTKGYSLAGWRY